MDEAMDDRFHGMAHDDVDLAQAAGFVEISLDRGDSDFACPEVERGRHRLWFGVHPGGDPHLEFGESG